jgi:hypothetical protein
MTTTLDEIIEEGITMGKDTRISTAREMDEAVARTQKKLRAAYNTASGVIKGLKALQARDGSTFEFEVNEQIRSLSITTNIRVADPDGPRIPGYESTLHIYVNADGTMAAYGDTRKVIAGREYGGPGYEMPETETVKTTGGKPEPIVKFVAQKAAAKGLVS